MNTQKCQEILLELLRVGLIAIRNLADIKSRDVRMNSRLIEWTTLCHSVPSILLGRCDPRSVKYFIDGDASAYLRIYPSKQDTDFVQAVDLLKELEIAFQSSDFPP